MRAPPFSDVHRVGEFRPARAPRPVRVRPRLEGIHMTIESRPNAILLGCPAATFPETPQIRSAAASEHILKVLNGNRYEHFQRTAEVIRHHLGELSVFTWTGSTYVAE